MQSSLSMKFAWKLLVGNSLWAEFFRKNYVGEAHSTSVLCNQWGTRFWKGILSVLPLVISNTKYLVCRGDINIWYGNWLGDGALAASFEMRGDPSLKINLVLANTIWDAPRLLELLHEEIVNKIVASQVQLRAGSDILIWTSKAEGIFSTKSVWEIIREK